MPIKSVTTLLAMLGSNISFIKNTKIIGESAFQYSSIEEIDFGGTEQIGVLSFDSCNGLTQISLPDSVESINSSSFHSAQI